MHTYIYMTCKQEPLRTLPGFISQIVQARVCVTRVSVLLLAAERSNTFGSLLRGQGDAYSANEASTAASQHDASCTHSSENGSTHSKRRDLRSVVDHSPSPSSSPLPSLSPRSNGGGISILGADLYWDDEGAQSACLRDVRLEVNAGALVLVVGRVGSGKSSLLAAIAGEMNACKAGSGLCREGDCVAEAGRLVRVSGGVCYSGQQAWIQHMTCRQNIVFGSDWDPERLVWIRSSVCCRLPLFGFCVRMLVTIGYMFFCQFMPQVRDCMDTSRIRASSYALIRV
jgi:ABC-type transport system involved in cytochrome bd biosynthesis fused ATPase/permease subunit